MLKRFRLDLLLVMIILAPSLLGSTRDGVILEREPVGLPSWDEAMETTDVVLYADRDDYDSAANDSRYVFEKIWYSSDGLRVAAYAYYPRGAEALPAVVFNRGSFVRGEIAPELLALFHRLGEAGYAVVAPLYRQSAGGEGKDELGGADLADLMNVVPLVRNLPFVDPNRLYLYGESRGGMMVFQALRDGFPAVAAATFGAFTDFEEMTAGEKGLGMARYIWGDFDERRDEIIERRSVIQWPEKIERPVLLMHGGADESVSPAQTLRLALSLERAGAPYGLIIFEGDRHVLPNNREERDRQAIRWFDAH